MKKTVVNRKKLTFVDINSINTDGTNVNEKSCNPTSFGQQKKSKTKTPRHSKVNQISEFRYKI